MTASSAGGTSMSNTDHGRSDTPSPDAILDMLFGSLSLAFLKLPILRAGLELHLWQSVAAGHRTAAAVASAVGADEIGLRQLLDALTVMKLLEKDDAGYRVPAFAERYLLPGKPTYLGDFVLEWLAWERHGHLAEAIRTGQRPVVPDVTRPESVEHFLPFYAVRAFSPQSQGQRYADYWQMLQVYPRPDLRVLDLACGAGIATLVLAMKDPGIRLTLQDWPAMLNLAEQTAHALGVHEQIELLPGDLLTVDYGSETFDVARLGYVTYFFSRDVLGSLFAKVRTALSPGGMLVVDAPLCDEGRCEKEEEVLDGPWLFAVSAGGDVYSFSDYEGLLHGAGFGLVTQVDDGLIKAQLPQ
jgi:SAM-dependent methyltransferase